MCQVGLPCCFCKSLGDGLRGSNFFQSMAHEAYKESVTLAHLIWVWECEAWGWSGLSRFWLILWDFLDVHPLAGLGFGRVFLSISQSGCLGVVLSLHNGGQWVI